TSLQGDWSSDVCSSDLLFELGDDEVRFSCGNREFARVLGLERSPSPGRTVREVFDPAEHGAVLDLFARVRHGRDPQSYFVAQRRSEERRVGKGWRSGWG